MSRATTAPTTTPALDPEASARRQPLLQALRDLGTRTAAPELAEPAVAPAQVAATLAAILDEALAILQRLQAIDDEAGGGGIGDLGFASALELRRVQRELSLAKDPDDVVVAAEAARRKLRRGVRAVLEAAVEAGEPDLLGGVHAGTHQVADLAPALVVRRMYATFRRALRPPADDSPEAVLTAVRYGAGALAILVTSTDYAEVRASDRIVLRRLRERILHWARHDRAPGEGQRLLADLATTASLLRGINRRQELRAHDAALIAGALAASTADPAAWIATLAPLGGLDDGVDALLARAEAGEAPGELVADLRVRLERLR